MSDLFTNSESKPDLKHLFQLLIEAPDEERLDKIITKYPQIFRDENWKPLEGNHSNYGVVKNQQLNPLGALIEKATNSVDALYLEAGIYPKSDEAPRSMEGSNTILSEQ